MVKAELNKDMIATMAVILPSITTIVKLASTSRLLWNIWLSGLESLRTPVLMHQVKSKSVLPFAAQLTYPDGNTLLITAVTRYIALKPEKLSLFL